MTPGERCKPCKRAYNRAYYERNAERERRKARERHHADPEAARERNRTVDHIKPLARGGKHEIENLAPACLPCNCSKGTKLLSEWSGRAA